MGLPGRAGLATKGSQYISQLRRNINNDSGFKAAIAQGVFFQIGARGPLHHQDRLTPQPLESDQAGHMGMLHLFQHEGLFLQPVLKVLRQIDAGELEHVIGRPGR